MRGKNKCKILKQIRQKIADENDIPFITQECTFQGECKGTCPKCEAELRYLEQQLEKRQRLGKTVTVAALAASLMANLTACPSADPNEHKASAKVDGTFFAQGAEDAELDGAPTETVELIGVLPAESQWGEDVKGEIETEELEGDVVYIEPEETLDPDYYIDSDESELEGLIVDESEIDNYFEIPTDDDAGYVAGMIPVDESTCEIPTDGDE